MPPHIATIGAMRETLTIQHNAPAILSVSSLTRGGTTATAMTAVPHGYVSGEYVTLAGATTGYNGKVRITVTGLSTFTHPVSGALATPATGTITVVYTSDPQGGRKVGWTDLATIRAEMVPLSAMERLQAQAISAVVRYRFRTWTRPDVTEDMRVRWTPTWPKEAPEHTLEISGVLPWADGRQFMEIEAGEVT